MFLRAIYGELLLITQTFSKNPNRRYSHQNLIEKRDAVYVLQSRFDFAFRATIRDSSDLTLLNKFNALVLKTLTLIDEQIAYWVLLDMSNFDINVAMKIPAISEARDVNVRDFLDEVDAIHSTLNGEGKTALIRYVFKAKIKGQVKTKIGGLTITTFTELETALKSRVKPENTQDKLFRKLTSASQGKHSLTNFATYVESITDQMSGLMIQSAAITDAGQRTQVTNVFKMLALQQFKVGVQEKYKTLLDASKPSTLGDALATASASSSNDQSSHINYINKGQYNDGRRKNNNGRGQNGSNNKPNGGNRKKKFNPKNQKPKRINNIDQDEEENSESDSKN